MLMKFIQGKNPFFLTFGRAPGGGSWTTAAWLTVVLPIMAIEWIVFKRFYPYADFFVDSYSYIQAAAQGDVISFRPVGYSVFLRLVKMFTSSDTVLVTLQYALVQGATLGLVLSLRRWCGLKERPVGILMAFAVLNPVIPYVCNYVSSDALFIGLSLIWLTVLMGLLRDPAWWRIWLQVGLLFMVFNVRYVALFYPAVAALTVLLTKRGFGYKFWGVALSVGVVVATTLGIKEVTKRETGADLFSAFSGWQIANNSLILYEHIPVDTTGLPSPECQELAGYTQRYFQAGRRRGDTARNTVGAAEVDGPSVDGPSSVTTWYMWSRSSPLHQYKKAYMQRNRLGYFTAWNRVAVVFTQYGYFVIKRHPVAFLRYYGWPSAKTFFLPVLDVFQVYNMGDAEVDAVAKNWFHYSTLRPTVASATIQARLLAPMPWIVLLLNITFIVAAALLLPSRALRLRDAVFTGSYELVSAFLLANACFCIFASPSVFRYQVLPMILLFVFTVSGISKSRIFFVPSIAKI